MSPAVRMPFDFGFPNLYKLDKNTKKAINAILPHSDSIST